MQEKLTENDTIEQALFPHVIFLFFAFVNLDGRAFHGNVDTIVL